LGYDRFVITRDLAAKLSELATVFPVLTLTGPRQSGKTTLCRMVFPDHSYVSLEAPDLRRFAAEDPRGFLAEYPAPVILDEVQRVPDLLSYIQVAVDEEPAPGGVVVTGSANFALLESVTQSLAGRTAIANLLPCGHQELLRFPNSPRHLFGTIQSGSYPAIFDRGLDPVDWYRSYITTTLERDVRQIVNVEDLGSFQVFLELCAGQAGQLTNFAQLAADTGVSANTAKAWLSVLETAFFVFRLRPYSVNLRSRVVKTPKLYFYDTGLACALLGITDGTQLVRHPLRGALFENWVVSEVLKWRVHNGLRDAMFFLRDRKGFEVDLLVETGDRAIAAEIKSGQTVASDFFKNLSKLASWGPDRFGGRDVECRLVYGGDRGQRRSDCTVIPWDQVKDQDW
jgi:predicted AAA+ superfamily ATPase